MADEHRFTDSSQLNERTSVCLNCAAPLTGSFCARCGQRNIPPYPSVRELAVDAVSEFSGWDGRLASTLRDLIRHPGVLTHEFLEGRRARYISPLRLYLTTSLVYFLLAASAPDVRFESGRTPFLGLKVSTTTSGGNLPTSRPERVANAASTSVAQQQPLTAAEKAAAIEDIKRAPALLQPLLRRAVEDPRGFKRRLLETMPRMLFVLLPIFAGILALFYRGRKYPEHLYFAIHLHAFVFLALGVEELLKFTRSPTLVAVASFVVVCWIPIYATLALRRVYGGSVSRTLLKELGIAAIYGVTASLALVITIFWVSVAA